MYTHKQRIQKYRRTQQIVLFENQLVYTQALYEKKDPPIFQIAGAVESIETQIRSFKKDNQSLIVTVGREAIRASRFYYSGRGGGVVDECTEPIMPGSRLQVDRAVLFTPKESLDNETELYVGSPDYVFLHLSALVKTLSENGQLSLVERITD